MKRELKFRCWDRIGKEFRKNGLLIRIDGKGVASSNSEHYIIQQFTGLKDKNGKKIYEGDIVETDKGLIGFINWYGSLAKFGIHQEGTTSFEESEEAENAFASFNQHDELTKVKVIGNIYENKNLNK